MSQTKVKRKSLEEVTDAPDLKLLNFRPTIFHPIRFLILKILAGDPSVDFRELRKDLGNMPNANLASHLRALEKENLVQFQKRIEGRKAFTVYSLTSKGIDEYFKLRYALEEWAKLGER